MSIRKLPGIPAVGMRAGISSDVSPRALDKWQMDVRAADDAGQNVISMLDVIGQDFFGNGVTAKRVAGALRAIGEKDVIVHLNSPGGDFFEGLAIYNLLREHPKKITVKVLGIAASAASVIAMAGDRIEVPRAGFLMIHNTWVVAVGDRHDLMEFAQVLKPFDDSAANVYAARSGLDEGEIHKMMDKETWIGGADAVDKGFADALLPADQLTKGAKADAALLPQAAAHRIDVLLAKQGVPRSERRRLVNELKSGTPSAADDEATRDAGEGDLRSAIEALDRIDIPLQSQG